MIQTGHTKCTPDRAAGAVVTILKVRRLHTMSVVHASSASATSSESKRSRAAPLQPSCRSHPAEAHNVAQSKPHPQLWDGRARQRAWPSAIHGSLVYCTRVSDLHWWDICGPQASLRAWFATFIASSKPYDRLGVQRVISSIQQCLKPPRNSHRVPRNRTEFRDALLLRWLGGLIPLQSYRGGRH